MGNPSCWLVQGEILSNRPVPLNHHHQMGWHVNQLKQIVFRLQHFQGYFGDQNHFRHWMLGYWYFFLFLFSISVKFFGKLDASSKQEMPALQTLQLDQKWFQVHRVPSLSRPVLEEEKGLLFADLCSHTSRLGTRWHLSRRTDRHLSCTVCCIQCCCLVSTWHKFQQAWLPGCKFCLCKLQNQTLKMKRKSQFKTVDLYMEKNSSYLSFSRMAGLKKVFTHCFESQNFWNTMQLDYWLTSQFKKQHPFCW